MSRSSDFVGSIAKALATDGVRCVLVAGPPGCGKTTACLKASTMASDPSPKVVPWDPVATGSRAPVMDRYFSPEPLIIVFSDDLDVALSSSRAASQGIAKAVQACKHPDVKFLMSMSLSRGDPLPAALGRVVDVRIDHEPQHANKAGKASARAGKRADVPTRRLRLECEVISTLLDLRQDACSAAASVAADLKRVAEIEVDD